MFETHKCGNKTCSGDTQNLQLLSKVKQKYRGLFEAHKSRNKTSSGEIGLNIRTLSSPIVGQNQVAGRKRPLLVCPTHCKCSMKTSHN